MYRILQTICSTALFSMTVVCFHTVSVQITGRLGIFCATTLIWGVNHTGAGFIVVAFNRDVRKALLRLLRITTSPAITVSSLRPVHTSRF
ncbi:hypothetical protein OSTOST_11382 [Ostertagia ostertagi]